ncbi:hypothetical protein HZU67_04912 [Apis mellifera carnica]|nr:hypothetical protein HZU67_04912 [Apis mellifera carnica]
MVKELEQARAILNLTILKATLLGTQSAIEACPFFLPSSSVSTWRQLLKIPPVVEDIITTGKGGITRGGWPAYFTLFDLLDALR